MDWREWTKLQPIPTHPFKKELRQEYLYGLERYPSIDPNNQRSDNDQIIECLLYRVENLNLVLRGNESKFPPELPCLSRLKSTLEETLPTLENFRKRGFLVKFFLAHSYKDDFTRLNSSLTESLNDLHFVLTAVKPDIVVDPKTIAEEIYQRLLNTLPEYVCSNLEHVNDLVDMTTSEQNSMVDLMVEHQSLEREPILATLAQLKEQKAQNPSAFQRYAAQKLSSSFSVKAGPPLPANTLLPVDVDSRIGEGTFGNVYQGSLASSVEVVAVKFIQVLSQTDRKMFEREVGSLRRLSECPYVVKYQGWIESILDPITQKSCVAIVLEYCPRSLASIVLDFDLDPPLSEWIRYLHQIAVGMRHLSLMGVIHRDLKPDNILITANNEIAITDFGLSITKSSIQRMSASQKLGAAGTIGYMAPEEEASEFSDVYAYGVIMSFVLNRAEPWVDNRGKILAGTYLQQATRSRLPRLVTKEMFPECSASFLTLIDRCCAQLPWQRPRFVEIEEQCAVAREESKQSAAEMVKQGYKYYSGTEVKQDYVEAVRWYRQAAERGHVDAMFNLGVCYENGQGVVQDYAEAVGWYRQAAERGHVDAMHNLGLCYKYGRGVSQDYAEAARWYRQAADRGHVDAMFNLGVCYENGQSVIQDYAEAVRWYRQAADRGHADAMHNLGLCYKYGRGLSQDYAEAVRWYRQAVEKGQAGAMNSLGVCYENGQSVIQDYAEAVGWYRQAAERGHVDAKFSLGGCFENGKGVSQDYAEAVRWYKQAVEQGHAGAMHNLGCCYEKGRGVCQDYVEAVRWYRQAAEKGEAGAMYNLGLSFCYGPEVSVDYVEAVRWLRQAAERGHADAMLNLGLCFENGKGVIQDSAEAVRWYRQAAEKGHAGAMFNLGLCFENGKGVSQDSAEAVRWYRQAAEKGHAGAMNNLRDSL